MQVRIGSTLSDLYDQEQDVPQGSILSTTLFNIIAWQLKSFVRLVCFCI